MVVTYGLLMETVDVIALPAPRKIMAKEAPNAAALDIPKVKGEARGFRRMHCITTPATAKPAPASKAPMIRTMRMFQTIPPSPLVSKVKIDLMTVKKDRFLGPYKAATITQTTSNSKPAKIKRRLRFTKPL